MWIPGLSQLKTIGLGIVAGGVGLLALLYRMRGKKLRKWHDVAAVGKERKDTIERTAEMIREDAQAQRREDDERFGD